LSIAFFEPFLFARRAFEAQRDTGQHLFPIARASSSVRISDFNLKLPVAPSGFLPARQSVPPIAQLFCAAQLTYYRKMQFKHVTVPITDIAMTRRSPIH
jgi:hypothetical protein